MAASSTILSLDVGEKRIGVARADLAVCIASVVATLDRTETIIEDIQKLVLDNDATAVIIGLPRGLDGQETAQTQSVRRFADQLQPNIAVDIIFQDEALTSRQAEAELEKRGKPYKKSDIDALAAIYILEDYMASIRKGTSGNV